MAVQGVSGLDGVLAPSHCLPPRLRTRDINSRHALRVEFCVLELRPTHGSGCRRPGRTHARKLVAPQCVLIRTEAGWPGSLNRFPVSVISVPLTFRMQETAALRNFNPAYVSLGSILYRLARPAD